jgi:uncharacterized tellurite resistance protein B-like protein
MDEVADSTARWLGILTTGLLVGREDEVSARRARDVLGGERLAELRRWFDEQTPEALRDVKIAVVEACISMVHADRVVDDSERELVERVARLSELDDATCDALVARIDTAPDLAQVAARVPSPALRELLLALAWQIATADGQVRSEEHGAYGVLADQLGVEPRRAYELRTLLR